MSEEEEGYMPVFVMGHDVKGHLVCMIMELPVQPGLIGVMLADAVQHFGNAYADIGEDKQRVEAEILRVFGMEIACPTDNPRRAVFTGKGAVSLGEAIDE